LLLAFPCLVFFGALPARALAAPFRMQFVGDIMLDGGPGHIISNDGNPFAFLEEKLLDADITVGNLECAITHAGHAVDKPYAFLGPESALPLLKRYFTGVTIANNHSGDWGKAGFTDQLRLMKNAGLPWFGGGANLAQAHQALIVNRGGRKVALLGYNGYQPRSFAATRSGSGIAWLIERDVIDDIRRTRQQQQPDLVVLFLHWGTEFDEHPSEAQRVMAQHFVDVGADVIVGAHPHVTQTIEWYRDKPIVYSLGNFMFDYFPGDPPLWTGWLVRLTYGDGPKPKLEVIPVQLDSAGVPHLEHEKR
jgi:poly-gamma-glutamate synthesis protein (capsule biosynthesis protein)